MERQKKLAILIPVGDCNINGYQYHSQLCLDAYSREFEKIYLFTNTKSDIGLSLNANNELLRWQDLLFDQNEDEEERFDLRKQYEGIFRARRKAAEDGFEYSITVPINSFVLSEQAKSIKSYVNFLSYLRLPIGYLGRKFVSREWIFEQDAQFCYIWRNVEIANFKYDVDVPYYYSYRYPNVRSPGLRKLYFKNAYIYDLVGVYTESDYKNKQKFYERAYRRQIDRLGDKPKTFFRQAELTFNYLKLLKKKKVENDLKEWQIRFPSGSNSISIDERASGLREGNNKNFVKKFIHLGKVVYVTFAPIIAVVRFKKEKPRDGNVLF